MKPGDEDVYAFQFNGRGKITRYLQRALSIELENSESSILVLSQSSQTPLKSVDFLNTLMKTYLQWGVDQNNKIASNTIQFVDKQLKVISDSLVIKEHALEKFQRKSFTNRIFIDELGNNNVDEVMKLEDEQKRRIVEKSYYEAILKLISEKNYSDFPSSNIFGFQDRNLDAEISILRRLDKERMEMRFETKEGSVVIQRKDIQIESQIEKFLD